MIYFYILFINTYPFVARVCKWTGLLYFYKKKKGKRKREKERGREKGRCKALLYYC